MGTTANGLPYPEPSDPIAAGAAAIQALTNKLRFWAFTHTFATMTSASQSVDYTYPVGMFTAAPVAVVSSGHAYSIFNANAFDTYVRLYIVSRNTSSYNDVKCYIWIIQPTI